MGQAKRKREQGGRISHCRSCTYCCVLPAIGPLDKPMYRACSHLKDRGCGIFGQPERPAACLAYRCAYLEARETDSPEKNKIPHPLEAGAYFHRDPVENAIVLFVDPARPEIWKMSIIPDLLRPHIESGTVLVIIDRGRQLLVKSASILDEILKRDFVAFANTEGRPLDHSAFAEEWKEPS
ncbi:MAG: hypothetical protein KDI98_00570 [Hyphomicrobiaceae bacterium]|nr:hypothetical protein [Hyphomicrobiaceae bacterium]